MTVIQVDPTVKMNGFNNSELLETEKTDPSGELHSTNKLLR
jgi:hypothetical protein